ncbi:uncharacterized protein PV09_05308 [Verruconis gallopava]|uniref:Uncharacterized protein n=1 Tax=Verruconis gallopava TaxID=253628 RepID=A0A0D1YSG7_9PEZI|nr:uncharacterized protein PV09_05308 [Verruconis gallopava]KIW03547.1 hypothetical protein PV09_05308 [Verruconis gallopava]
MRNERNNCLSLRSSAYQPISVANQDEPPGTYGDYGAYKKEKRDAEAAPAPQPAPVAAAEPKPQYGDYGAALHDQCLIFFSSQVSYENYDGAPTEYGTYGNYGYVTF